jgi:hypothetical protein
MPGPLASNVHVDTLLTDVSIGYVQSNENYIARKGAPTYKVSKDSDKYPVWDRSNFLRMQTQQVSDRQKAPEANYDLSNDTYTCGYWPVKHMIPDKLKKRSDVDLEKAATEFLTQQILMRRDYEYLSLLFSTSNWTYYTGKASGGDFIDFSDSSSTPFKTVRTYKRAIQQAIGMEPNTIVVGPEVDDTLKEHDDALAKIQYTQTGIVTNKLLAAAFDVKNYLVGKAVYNTAQAGATISMSNMGGDYMWIGYVAESPSEMNPSALYTFSLSDYDDTGEGGALIKRWREDDPEGEWFKAESAFQTKITSSVAGVLLEQAASD